MKCGFSRKKMNYDVKMTRQFPKTT